eukprot:COSAG05_NODE_651_length_8095_cov_17.048572_4_plen_201_part_00
MPSSFPGVNSIASPKSQSFSWPSSSAPPPVERCLEACSSFAQSPAAATAAAAAIPFSQAQDVLGLDIPVHHASGVAMPDCAHDLPNHLTGRRLGEGRLAASDNLVKQITATHNFLHEVDRLALLEDLVYLSSRNPAGQNGHQTLSVSKCCYGVGYRCRWIAKVEVGEIGSGGTLTIASDPSQQIRCSRVSSSKSWTLKPF